MNKLIRNIKKGEGPVYRRIRSVARWIALPQAPRLPAFLKSPLRFLYEAHFGVIMVARRLVILFYRHPLFQARCASVGKNLVLGGLPFVSGHVEIHIGDDVNLGGRVGIISGGQLEQPKLIIGDRSTVNWNVIIMVSREVVIEEDVLIAYDCRISDTDGHPREADRRARNVPVDAADIRPVRICRNAWIGNGSHIMKGVTVGEGAVIGANSVVIADVPPYSLAMGNPAEVYFRNFGRPKAEARVAG